MKKIKKILKIYLIIIGLLAHLFIFWMGFRWPLFFDQWLIVAQKPMDAEAIVCLSGGLASANLPTPDGWRRIITTVQLYEDGWAPVVIFTGGGTSSLSEGEAYAEVAKWLGLKEEAIFIDPLSGSTADHPVNILKLKLREGEKVKKDSKLLIVTSPLHSRRAWLCFRKAGFSNFRMITGYRAYNKEARIAKLQAESKFRDYQPSGKKYDDFLFNLRRRSDYFWQAVREGTAIGWYWLKGKV